MKKESLNALFLKFFIIVLIILFFTRVAIFFSFGSGFKTNELINAFWLGFRFDLKLIATALLPALLIYILSFKKIPVKFIDIYLQTILVVIVIFSFINYGYYEFFNQPFNAIFFGIVNDGTKEVLKSIVSNKRMLLLAFLAIVTAYVTVRLFRKKYFFIKDTPVSFIVSFILLIFLARGSLGTFPLSKKTINSVDNKFLSQALLNPIWQLYYAYGDLKLNRLTSPKKVLKRYKIKSYEELLQKAGFNARNPLLVATKKDAFLEKNRPNIVFVLMESWSSYIALFNAKDNDVLGSFAKHAKQDYFFLKFFSNAYGTNPTIEALLLNSPVKDLSQSKGKDTKFSLFALKPYIEKGYKTFFISGGSSSWRNHNDFWTKQGFDRYIGRASIEEYFKTRCDNTWGVYDELLFKYIEQNLFNNGNEPFFAFVLTTNNHPPVELPKNFKMPKINLNYYGLSNDDEEKKIRLGAYHYQTNALGEFLTWLKHSKYKDNTIVVATGDHIIKGFKDYKLPKELFYKYAVPLYLYVPQKYDKLKNIDTNIVGSHNDIFPTLYHLTLSQATYYNFGTPLMQKDKETFGWNEYKRYIFYSGVSDGKKLYGWDKNLTVKKEIMLNKMQKKRIIEQKYKNILIEYLLNDEVKNSHRQFGK